MRMLTLWYGPGYGVSVKQYVDDFCWLNSNAIHADASDHPSSRRAVRELHRRGVRIIFPVACSYGEAGTSLQEHPDWAQTDGEGKRTSYCCVNSPWRAAFFVRLQDILRRFEVDGIFLDGPFMAAEACYCEHCLAKFEADFGQEQPRKPDWNSRLWKQFIRWKYESIAEFLGDAKAAVVAVRPDAPIYGNCCGTHRIARESARDPQLWARHVDILGAEAFMYYPDRFVQRPLWAQSITAKSLTAAAGGKPAVVFITFAVRPWYHRPLPPAMIKLTAAQTFANGASPWYECVLPRSPEAKALAKTYRFFAEREAFFDRAESAANVAVLWSRQTGDFYGLDPEESSAAIEDFVTGGEEAMKRHDDPSRVHITSLRGTCDALIRSHIPFDLIHDQNLLPDKDLSRYAAIVLPNAACLSDPQCEAVRRYVASGGGLVATYETSLFDEWGDLRADLALGDVLGVRRSGPVLGPLSMRYFSGPRTRHPLLAKVRWLMPSTDYLLPAQALTGRNVLLQLVAERFAYAKSGPDYRSFKLAEPFLVAGRFGKGRTVYFAGDIGDRYWKHPLPEIRQLLANAVRWASRDALPVSVDAPETVEAVLTRQPSRNRVLLHLINCTGEMANPISRILPVSNISVHLKRRWLGAEVKKVFSISSGKNVPFRSSGRDILVEVPVLDDYDALCFDLVVK
jgi:hypothetical protein